MSSPRENNLRHNADFKDQLGRQSEDSVREELELPDVQAILRDLQERHGVRLTLTKAIVDKLDSLKSTSVSDAAQPSACQPNDICILCDRHDICQTCDALDWCVSVDYHIVEEV